MQHFSMFHFQCSSIIFSKIFRDSFRCYFQPKKAQPTQEKSGIGYHATTLANAEVTKQIKQAEVEVEAVFSLHR